MSEVNLVACIEAAKAGGLEIANYKRPAKTKLATSPVEHHAIVTSDDYKSQYAILRKLNEYDTEALLMTEEHVGNENFKRRLLRSGDLDKLSSSRIYIIDELDGSSSRSVDHYEWSISVGCVDRLDHIAGAVFAPKVFGGTLFYASKDKGMNLKTGGNKAKKVVVSRCDKLKDAYVIVGPDLFLKKYPIHNRLLVELGDASRTINSNGSCALALGLVASGKVDALVQPPQAPWDWAAGKLFVEEAGGSIVFYEMESGVVKPIEKLEPKHYNPDTRSVGFVAGNEMMTNEIIDMLMKL